MVVTGWTRACLPNMPTTACRIPTSLWWVRCCRRSWAARSSTSTCCWSVGWTSPGRERRAVTQLSYALQWRWHGARPWLSPGLQGFGSLGRAGQLHSETFNLGPALFGESALGGGRKLKYNGALLAGLTRATPDATVRFELEYEFF